MTSSLREVESWLRAASPELCGRPCDPAQISLVEGGSIIDASFRVGNEWQRVIVKRLHGDASNVAGFLTTHERLIKVNPYIATFTPQFLGLREGDLWIAMQFIPGETLEARMLRAIATGPAAIADCNRLLSSAGRLFAEFTRVFAGQIGLDDNLRANRTFVPLLENWVRRYRGHLLLGGSSWCRLGSLSKQLTAEFLSREGDRVLPIDCQPKNILVGDGGRLHFIDVAYGTGCSALGLGQFLASLDRINLRRPSAPTRIFEEWKKAFLDGYLAVAPPTEAVRDDLRFFYPWAILHTLSSHRSQSPFLGRLATFQYARRFAASIRDLWR